VRRREAFNRDDSSHVSSVEDGTADHARTRGRKLRSGTAARVKPEHKKARRRVYAAASSRARTPGETPFTVRSAVSEEEANRPRSTASGRRITTKKS
jgi:hypothetical protein